MGHSRPRPAGAKVLGQRSFECLGPHQEDADGLGQREAGLGDSREWGGAVASDSVSYPSSEPQWALHQTETGAGRF